MNIQQQFIVLLVTAVIILLIGVFLKFVEKYVDKNTLATASSKYLIGLVILLIWFFFVFVSSLQMQINELSKNFEKFQKHMHGNIMKKYIEIEDKCAKLK
tara:strand:+ start:5885 stop:6184 length:300 start_codon:yes stop_codon:yes gene_type:complete